MARMNGAEESLIIDTGAPISIIKDSVVDELKLPIKPYPRTGAFPSGISPSAYATVDTLSVGTLTGHGLRFYLVPSVQIRTASGSFGADFLQSWDVDFDFEGSTLNFISPDRCDGNPVYWTQKSYAALPLDLGDYQNLRVTLELDHKQVAAVLDTGAASSFIGAALAAQLFGIHAADQYTFKSLKFGNVTVDNPILYIADGGPLAGNEVLIGMPVLKQLHLYVSYRNKTAYLTRADAR